MGNSRKTALPTLFLGEYEHALDPQCRVTLPSEWRNKEEGTNLVLIPARDAALLLLPIETFMEFVERARKYAIANAKMQAAFAYLGSRARNCRCDKQGRIALDRKMLDDIGVAGQLKMIGAITHIRLCAPEKWQTPTPEAISGHLSDIQSVSDGGSDSDGLAALLGDILKK
jgi:MraZ protein